MTPKDSLLARCLAVLSAALLAVAWTVGISVPASAAPVKGSLDIVSITDTASGLGGPVQNRPFNVVVRVLDTAGQPTTVNQVTTIVLEGIRPRRSGRHDNCGHPTQRLRRHHLGCDVQPIRQWGCAACPSGIRSGVGTGRGDRGSRPHGGRRQRHPAQLVDSHGFKLCRSNRGGANLRSVSPAKRCQWSRHLVSRFLRRARSMPHGGASCHRHCEPQGRRREPALHQQLTCHSGRRLRQGSL